MKKVLKIALALVCVLFAGCLAAGYYMCSYALLPEEHGNDFEATRDFLDNNFPGLTAWYDSLHSCGVMKDTVIIGERGYRLHAVYASVDNPQGCAVVVHGYTNNHMSWMNLSRMYRDSLHFNVIVPDLHYHGLSEGRAIQMGWFDRLDVRRFAELAHGMWNDPFLIVHGVSMGGATTMMLSGDDLPDYYRAFIDDCGYSSVWEQFAYNMRQTFGLPPFPVLHSASLVCKIRYGWSFRQASSLKQLARCTRPILFIHGGADTFVPTEQVYGNYEAASAAPFKELWIAPESTHAMSYRDHTDEYVARVRAFILKVKEL